MPELVALILVSLPFVFFNAILMSNLLRSYGVSQRAENGWSIAMGMWSGVTSYAIGHMILDVWYHFT